MKSFLFLSVPPEEKGERLSWRTNRTRNLLGPVLVSDKSMLLFMNLKGFSSKDG